MDVKTNKRISLECLGSFVNFCDDIVSDYLHYRTINRARTTLCNDKYVCIYDVNDSQELKSAITINQ